MASIPPLRPLETGSDDVEPAAALRGASPVRTAAAIAAAAAVFLAIVVLLGVGRLDAGAPAFLENALGPEEAEAPLTRTPAPGVGVRIHDEGYTVTRWGASVSVVAEDVGGSTWRRHVHGVTRETEFGAETIVVDGSKTEEFLTVSERQSERTWRWKLATRLVPRLSRDGSVGFLDPTAHRVTGIVVDPVRILDTQGNDVTPDGLRWGVERDGSGSWLVLELDDSDLPLPYVIDPAVSYRTSSTDDNGNGSGSLTLDVPAGTAAKDLLVVHLAIRGTGTITAPSGWTQLVNDSYSWYLRQVVYYRVATGSDPASYQWTFSSTPAAGGMSAFYGVKTSDPVDVADTSTRTGNSDTVSASSITTTADDSLVLALFSARRDTSFTQASGMTERYESSASGDMSVATDTMIEANASGTGTKTSDIDDDSRWSGTQVSFRVDDVAPTGSVTDPGANLSGTVVVGASADDTDSAVASVLFQGSPADAGTWTDVAAADTTAPYSVSFDSTAIPDGLYDLRVIVMDAAGNTFTSAVVQDRRVDNTAPSSTTSFPVASTTYGAAGWNAGCATNGFCGTHSDAGSGVAGVEVSIRRGTGNYWSGGSFSSAAEVWNAVTLAGGDWSYSFAASSFPADGTYTVRVRATDAAGNQEAPSSRTFTIDTTAPQTTIGSNPADPTSATSADFSFGSSEGGSTFECRLDGGAWGACTSPASYMSLTDGSHTFEVRASDAVGNQDASPATYTWLVDTAAPSSTVTFPAAAGEYNAAGWDAGCATIGLCGTHADGAGSGVAAVEVSVRLGSGNYWDGSAFASASEVWNVATLVGGNWSLGLDAADFPADGDYTVRVRASDGVGNAESPSSRTFTIDTTDPGASFDFPAANDGYTNATWDAGCAPSGFCGTHADAGSGIQAVEVSVRKVAGGLYWNGTAFGSVSEVFLPATLAGGDWSFDFDSADFTGDGQYAVHVRATDDAGNTEGGPTRTFRIDNDAPTSTTSFPGAGGVYTAAAWDAGCAASGLCGTYSDAESGVAEVELSIRRGSGNYWDGTGFTSGSEVWNDAALAAGDWTYALDSSDLPADGDYTVRVRARDEAGNTESASTRTFTYDTAAPQTTIDSSPSDPSGSDAASFDFSASEPGSTFECRLDGGSWSACASPKNYVTLADGSHTFDVRATDAAGNTDATPATFTWLVDTTAPTSTATFPSASGSYTASEWDAGCTTAGLCGTYGDGAGSGVVQVEVSIRQGAGDYWDGTAFTSASEVWNDTALAAGDWSYDLAAGDFPADGSYTVRVRATDDAGNLQSASSRSFTYDATDPSSTTTFPADAGSYDASGWDAGCAASGLCGTYSDAESGVAEVELSIRRGSGNYWDGTGFTSGSEVWNDAALTAGDWTYALDSSDFPADGDYTVRVRAIDAASNVESAASRTFAYDTTAPQTTIDSGPAPVTDDPDASLDFSASEPGSTFECRLDGGAWSPCTSPKDYTSLADGNHTFDVRATDAAGNADATPASRSWLVDTAAPSSTTAFPAAAGEYDVAGWDAGCATAGLCGTYGDGGAGSGVTEVEVSIRQGSGDYWDGTAFTSATEVWNDAALTAGNWSFALEAADLPADGDYTVRARATDAAGLVETPSSRTFAFDTTDPSAGFAFPEAGGEYRTGGWNAGCMTVGFCGPQSDAGSGVAEVEVSVQRVSDDLYWDGDSFDAAGETFFDATLAGGDWSYAFTAASFPADGQYVVHARATDDAGNTDGGTSRTFRIDNTDPSADFDFPAAGERYDASGWNAGCTPNGVCGTHADAGSGVAEVEVSLKQVGSDLYWDGDSFDAAGETFFDATLTGGDWSYAFPAASFPADGAYTLHVRATDDAGNTESGPIRTFTFDTAAPQTTIGSSPSDPTSSSSADLGFSASESGSTFECRLDGGAWSACTSPESYAGLTDDEHTFEVRATDQAGNTDATPASFTWTVDTTAPSSAIGFPEASGEYDASGWNAGCAPAGACGTHGDGALGSGVASVEISVRQGSGDYWNGASFSSATEVLLDATLDAGSWSRPFPASNFPADGSYTVRVVATDEAGNANAGSSRTFTIDRTAPTGSLTAPADGAALRGASVAVSSDSADSGSGVASAAFERRPAGGGTWTTIDTDTNAPYSTDWNTTAVTDGDYDLRVLTTDQAGNTTTSTLRTVTVDNTAPSGATLDPLPSAIRDGHELTGSGADAGSGVDSVVYLYCEGAACSPSTPVGSSTAGPDYAVTWSGQPADGVVRVLARVTDRAGNSLDSDVQSVTIDNTNPTGSLTAPADGASVSGSSVAVSSDSADSGSGVASATFERRPFGGDTWTTIDTDTNAPYSTDWNTTAVTDGDYDLRVLTTDQAGNTTTSALRTVTVDNAAPSVTLTAPSGYVNAADPDPFTVTATTPDGDVDEVELFRCSNASAACDSGTWVSLGVDTDAPYSADWALDADGNRALRAVAEDGAGNTGGDVVDVTIDRTSPSGALTTPADAAYVAGASVAVSSDSADSGSGVASATFERRPTGGSTWTTIDTDTNAPYSTDWNTTALTDGDYDLRVVTTDQAGNTTTSTLHAVTVDNSAPSTPVITLSESSPHAHASGAEIFVNPDETGSFDVGATSADPHSGIEKVRFPGPADDSSSPYQASYQLDELSGAQTVTAFNRAGLTAGETFTVTPDADEPSGGSVSYPDGYDADGDVTIVVDGGTDALSSISPGSAVLERRTADLSDGSCAPFAGAWSTVSSPDTVASGLCAQYRYRVSDRVGNEAVYTSGDVVEVDLAAPSAPVLALSESSPYAHVSGTEIFLNTNESGSYDVEADSSDGASGLDKVVFPGGNDDTTAPYAATYDFDDLLGTETVTAHDRAGLTASSDFQVTEDVSAPSTTDDTATTGSDWTAGPVTVTLDPNDARSGVAATYYTTDGSLPTTSSTEGASVELTDDGVYTIRYFSVDRVGNVEPVRTAFAVIRIDGTDPGAPAISLSESSPYAHASGDEIFVNTGQTGSYDVGATASDSESGIDKIVFPGGVEDFTSPYSATYALADLSSGQTVTAHDGTGNTASDSFAVTPDTAPPAGGSVSYPDGWDADGTVTIGVAEGTDALSGVSMASAVLERRTTTLAGAACDPFTGAWAPVTSPDTVASGTCARYRYRVSDRVGNEVVYTLPANVVKVDTVAPQTTIDVAPSDPSADASPDFEFSADEPGSTYECRLDGGAWSACLSPESLTGLTDGNHTFTVRATDAAGNTDATPATHAWTIDEAGPETTIDVAPTDPSQDDTPVFEFSSSEPGSTFECSLDGGLWEACSSPETVGLLSDGAHTFDVRAVDGAGNEDGTPATHAWTVDTTAPDTSFTSVPSDPSNDPTPELAFSSTEPGSTFQCALDAGSWSPCASPLTVGPLADGSHTFEVRATDAAGNADATPAAHTWITDGGAPTVSITDPSGFVNAADADPYTVRATSPDGDVTSVELFRCSDDSQACATGTWVSLGTDSSAPYEASWPLDADGNRALRAVVVDVASNSAEDVVDVTIDRTVPASTIDSAPSDPSASTDASFAFGANEGGASFECRLDGGAWTACSSPQDYTALSEGTHDFSVRASDAAGNVEASPATHSWAVDTLAPQTTIDVAPSDPSADASPDFEFSADEPGSTYECRLDGGAWSACLSPESLTGLTDGNHTFTVRATDAAGNTDATPATRTWTVDATAPGGGLADPGQYLRGTIALTASPSDTGAGIQSVDFQVSPAGADTWTSIDVDATDPYGASWDTTAGADGLYDLRVVVTDNASNSSPSTVVEDRLVDNTAPTATMDDPGAYLRATVSLGSTSADAGSGVADVVYERSPAGAGAWTPVAASWATTGVADGLYDLRVTVTDNAGNSTTSAPVDDRRVDNTLPGLTASTPVDGSVIASAGTLAVEASEDVTGIVGAQIDGAGAPAPTVSGSTVTWTQSFGLGPHVLAGELEDLAGNRRPIRVHFTVWSGATADYPFIEKNSEGGIGMELRSPSDTATVHVPADAWTGAPAGDWLVLRVDPQPAAGVTNGFQPAGDILDVTAYWALSGTPVTSFALPLEIDVDNSVAHVVPATFENGAWRPLPAVPDGGGLPASWNDGFERDGTDVRILTRHLTLFTLLEDVQRPSVPGKFKGRVKRSRFALSWTAAKDNSGLISAYRVYANGRLLRTVSRSARSVAMGRFKLSDRRSFQLAAVDEAGNVSAKTRALKVVPRVTKLRLAAAKKALTKRGFKTGKVTMRYSTKVPRGKVVTRITGLRVAGTKIRLAVSKGRKTARRPVTSATATLPLPGSGSTPPPAAPAPAAAPAPEAEQPGETTTTPILGVRVPSGIVQLAGEAKGLAALRQELGFGILVAAFAIAFAAIMRARRSAPAEGESDELLWDQRLVRAIGRAFRRLFSRG